MSRLALAILAAAAPAAALIELDGSGTTNPSKFYWEVMSLFEARAKPAVRVTYRAVGSSTGQFEFMGEDQNMEPFNDFGSGDIPFNAEKYDALRAANVDVLHVPFSLGAMAFFDNVPEEYQPSGGLQMTACVLADVFNGAITTWDDDAIAAINDGFAPPAGEPIVVYHRTLGSSTTKGITSYLHEACPDKWPADLVGSTIAWPESTVAVQGSGEMSARIQDTPFSIGYIDAGHGIEDGLHEIKLENKAKRYQTPSEAIANGGVQMAAEEALATGVLPDDPALDFSGVSFLNMPGDTTWPIVAVSYLYVRGDQTGTGAKGPLLKAFVEYVLSVPGQALLPAYGFLGVPQDVIDVSRKALDAIVTDGSPAWTFETSTIKGGGQEDYVISAKRRSHYEYALGELEDQIKDVAEAEGGGGGASGDFATKAEVAELASDVSRLAGTVINLEDDLATLTGLVNDAAATCEAGCASHEHEHEHEHEHGTVPKHEHDDDDDDDDGDAKKKDVEVALAVAAAGLVTGLLGLVLGLVAYCRVNKLVSNRSPGQAARDCVPGGAKQSDYELSIQTPSNGSNGANGGMKRGFEN